MEPTQWIKGIPAISKALEMGRDSTRELIQSGELPVSREGRDPTYKILAETLMEWKRERERQTRVRQ